MSRNKSAERHLALKPGALSAACIARQAWGAPQGFRAFHSPWRPPRRRFPIPQSWSTAARPPKAVATKIIDNIIYLVCRPLLHVGDLWIAGRMCQPTAFLALGDRRSLRGREAGRRFGAARVTSRWRRRPSCRQTDDWLGPAWLGCSEDVCGSYHSSASSSDLLTLGDGAGFFRLFAL